MKPHNFSSYFGTFFLNSGLAGEIGGCPGGPGGPGGITEWERRRRRGSPSVR